MDKTRIKPFANLRDANLRDADLRDANLRDANLCGADLYRANLRGANLRGANLRDANLRDADLRDANLRDADLRDADLRNADLYRANLRGADLYHANLCGAIGITAVIYARHRSCPPSGDFIAWKKGRDGEIIKLRIPWFSRRVNAVGSRKCRSEMAFVLEIEKDGKPVKKCGSRFADSTFVYETGKRVCCESYDADWHVECSGGIHFFMTRQEAEDY